MLRDWVGKPVLPARNATGSVGRWFGHEFMRIYTYNQV